MVDLATSERPIQSLGDLARPRCKQRTCVDSILDAWGNELRLILYLEHFEIISAGPDGEIGTKDDIVKKFSFLSVDDGP